MMGLVSMTWAQYRRHECSVDGKPYRLTPQEGEILSHLLASGPIRPLGFDDFAEVLWPGEREEPFHADRLIRVVISRLRRIGIMIESRNRFGYRILAQDRVGFGEPSTAMPDEPARYRAAGAM